MSQRRNLPELDLDGLRAAQDVQQQGDAIFGHALHQGLHAGQGGILDLHRHAGLKRTEQVRLRGFAQRFGVADGLHGGIDQGGGLRAEHHQAADPDGGPDDRQRLRGTRRAQKQITGEHGFVGDQLRRGLSLSRRGRLHAITGDNRCTPACCAQFLEDLEQRQVDLEILAQQLFSRRGFLTWFGVGNVPDGWRKICRHEKPSVFRRPLHCR